MWSRLVPSGLVWSRVVSCGLVWSRLVSSGPVWSRLVPSGLVWSRLVSCGLVWSRVVSSGLVWSRLISSGLVWSRPSQLVSSLGRGASRRRLAEDESAVRRTTEVITFLWLGLELGAIGRLQPAEPASAPETGTGESGRGGSRSPGSLRDDSNR